MQWDIIIPEIYRSQDFLFTFVCFDLCQFRPTAFGNLVGYEQFLTSYCLQVNINVSILLVVRTARD